MNITKITINGLDVTEGSSKQTQADFAEIFKIFDSPAFARLVNQAAAPKQTATPKAAPGQKIADTNPEVLADMLNGIFAGRNVNISLAVAFDGLGCANDRVEYVGSVKFSVHKDSLCVHWDDGCYNDTMTYGRDAVVHFQLTSRKCTIRQVVDSIPFRKRLTHTFSV